MGFFSSRKAESSPLRRDTLKVIRSKFYGKPKSPGRASPTPAASPPAPSTPLVALRRISEIHVSSQSPSSTGRQVSADALTMSLAQRLNDLATANADGLLDDDEYRLLRQNLFERFATDSDAPVQSPVKPSLNGTATRDAYQHLKRTPSVNSQRSISTAVSSLFRRATGRSALSPSALSPAPSISGSIFSLQQQMSPAADSLSVVSGHSRPSTSSRPPHSVAFHSPLTRRESNESLMSSQAGSASGSLTSDLRTILSRRNIVAAGSTNYASSISSRATTRSAKPPSAYHLRHPTLRQSFSRTHEGDDDEDNPKTVAELRDEIQTVENEGRKLLDAFNGLELSALTRSPSGASAGPLGSPADINQRRLRIQPENTGSPVLGSANTLIPDRAGSVRIKQGQPPLVKQPVSLKRKPSVVDSITGSFKSSTSDLRSNVLTVAPPSLHSTRSSPNLQAEKASTPALSASKSVPDAPLKKRPQILRQMPPPSPSSNGASQHAVPGAVRPSPLSQRTNTSPDPTLYALQTELADIRRRKADVSARYERRLEFLRAKLKAAEIRERLTKK